MTKLLKCIIVDDEPPAIRLLEKFVNQVSFLKLVAATTKSIEALEIIEKNGIDIVFLDIQMPNLTGIQLSKVIRDETKVIFTTAYPQFALESYDLQATDYLLKPFTFERFYQAVQKIKPQFMREDKRQQKEDYLFIKTDGKNNFEKVYLNTICYIEGLKNYIAIHLIDKQIITYSSLKGLKENLPQNEYLQIHKSYIISIRHIKKTTSTSVFILGNELPIGNTYKTNFFNVINSKKL